MAAIAGPESEAAATADSTASIVASYASWAKGRSFSPGSIARKRVSGAARADYAAAAAAVVAGGDHDGAVYELGGDAFTLTDLAATITAVTGREVGYTNLSEDQFRVLLVGAGLPAPAAAVYADADRAASRQASCSSTATTWRS